MSQLHNQVQDLERYITFLQANRSQLQSPPCHTPSDHTPSIRRSSYTPSHTHTPPPSSKRRVRFAEPLQSDVPNTPASPSRYVIFPPRGNNFLRIITACKQCMFAEALKVHKFTGVLYTWSPLAGIQLKSRSFPTSRLIRDVIPLVGL